VDPKAQFFHLEGRVGDGDVIASYLGADLGVELMHERGVILAERPGESSGATVVQRLKGLLNQVSWRVSQIEHMERIALAGGSS
jgi:hypothetical protein